MAKDFLLKHLCPHYTVAEWLAVENDRKTILPLRNPSSAHVRVQRNGIDIPRSGLKSKISFAGSESQPFEIERGVSDQFRFTVNEGALQTVTLPSGNRVTADLVAQAINEQSSGIRALDSNGKVRIETFEGGSEATLFLKGGSGHEALGLPSQRFYQGQQIVPGWNLIRVPNTVDERARKIVFENVLPTEDDIFEISYYTRREECRRCSGLGVENDIRHDERGDPEFVTGIDLLAQEAEKIVLTVQGSNVFYRWYGTSLLDLVGNKIANGGSILETQLVSEIGQALERYRDVKIQQSRFQPIGDQEFLLRVRNIIVRQDENDPTVFRIRVDLQNRSGEVDELRKTLVVNNIDGFEFVG